jgi:PAS domain S-box-containing protein
MKKFNETEILLEIALQIGNSLDLKKMLYDSVSAILRLLNCSGAQVVRAGFHSQTNALHWVPELSMPRPIVQNIDFNSFIEYTKLPSTISEWQDWSQKLPIYKENGTKTRYLFNLPDFGVLVLEKNGKPFDSTLIQSLQPILTKLSNAALACFANSERILAEQALEKKEELIRSLFVAIPDLIIQTDLEGNITFVNEHYPTSLKHIPFHTFLGKNMLSFISKNDLPRAIENTKLMFNGTLGPKEYLLELEDGTMLDAEVNGDVIYDANHNPLGMVYVIRDITERKAFEAKNRDTLSQYKALFLDAADAIFIADMETGIVLETNSAASRLLDMPMEAIRGMHHSRLHPKTLEDYAITTFKEHIIEISGANQSKPLDSQIVRADGSIVPVEILASKIQYNGKPCVMGIFRDISERKQAEEMLLSSQANMTAIIENTLDNIWSINRDYEIVHINQNFARAFHAVFGVLLEPGVNIYKALPPVIQPIWKDRYDRALNGERFVFVDSVPAFGTFIHIEVAVNPIVKGDRVVGASFFGRDITARKQSEDGLKDAQANMVAILENALDNIWSINTDLKITYINQLFVQEYLHAFGVELKSGSNILDGLPEAIRPIWEERYNRVLSGERFVVVDKAEVGGSYIHVEVAMNPIVLENKVIGASMSGRNITERVHAEEKLRASQNRAAAQRSSLVNLTLDPVFAEDNITNALRRVTEEVSRAFSTARASIWLLNDGQTELRCLSLYDAVANSHTSNGILKAADIPAYFRAIKTENRINADDAFKDPRTCELGESYLKRLGITSMLDAGIFREGKLIGVVCAEHIGPMRIWQSDEESFISTTASIVAQLFLNAERKQAEEAVRQSQELLDATQRLAHIGGWEWDTDRKTMTWTDETYRIHGLLPGTPSPGSPRHIDISLACYDDNDRIVLNEAFRLIAEEGKPYDFEFPLTRVDGRRIWIRTMANAVKKGNRIIKVVGNIQDITERKQAEHDLKLSQETTLKLNTLLNAILESPQDLVVFALDKNYCYTAFTNVHKQVMKNLWGAEIEVGKNMLDYLNSVPDKNNALQNFNRCLAGEFFILEEEYGDESMQRSYYETRYCPLFADGDEIIGLTVFNIDITGRKQAEEELQIKNLAIESSINAIAIADLNGHLTYVNPSFLKLWGYQNSKEVVGKPSIGFWHSIEAPSDVISALQKQGNWRGEMMAQRVDGTEFIADVSASLIRSLQGKPLCMQASFIDISERKRMQDALLSSEGRHRALLAAIPDLMFLFSKDGFFIDYNANNPGELLMPPELFLNKHVSDALPEELATLTLDKLDLAFQSNQPQVYEYFAEINGRRNSFEARMVLSTNDTVLCIIRNNTDRKQAEIQVRKLSLAVEQSPASVVITATDGTIEYINPKFTQVTGYSLDEVLGKKPTILKTGLHSREYYEKLWGTISSGKEWRGEFQNKKKNGELFWESASISPIIGKKGRITHYLAVKEDITQRKRAEKTQQILYNIALHIHIEKSTEELLEYVRKELGEIIDTTNLFVALYNPENDTLQQLIFRDEMDNFDEWPVKQSISGQIIRSGKTIFLVGDDFDAFSRQHNIGILGTNPACWLGVPIFIHNKPGGVLVVQHYSNPKAYNTSDIVVLEMIAHEIGIYLEKHKMIEEIIHAKEKAEQGEKALQKMYHELQGSEEETREANQKLIVASNALAVSNKELLEAKERAEDSNRLKTAFLQNMSHEIRTPINAIYGFAGLLSFPDLSDEKRTEFISIIQNSTNQLIAVVNDILTISSIDTGQEKINNTNVALNTLIAETEAVFNQQISERPILVKGKKTLPDAESHIVTDNTKLNQILTNLLANAIKYTSFGEIIFGYDLKGDFLEFYVKDTGIGIEKSKHKLIFDRFVQADDSIRFEYGGTGLGLSICKGYVELLGGQIWVDSEPGKGSTFMFTIPYVPVVPKNQASMNGSIPIMQDSNFTILVAEDDEFSFILLNELLKTYNCRIIQARNGKEAVEACRQNPMVSMVLMDIKMPVMDGVTATRLIKDFRPTLPVIAQSAYATEQDIENAKGIFEAYITKPINAESLLNIINEFILKPYFPD